MFVDFFIHRPVFATVCALLIILAGAICIPNLPVAMYPNLAPPVVEVIATYVGADAQTVEKAVTIPLEESINGVEGMRYISRRAPTAASARSTSPFRPATTSTSPRLTCRIAWPARKAACPAKCCPPASTILKSNYNFVFGAGFYTLDGRYSSEFISNYLDVYVTDALKRVPGVGDVMIFGARKYAMRVWLDPIRLAARGLTATDVVNALMEQNVEVPAGSLGQPPADPKQEFQIPVHVVGRLTDPDAVQQHDCEEHAQRAGASERRWPRGDWRRELRHFAGVHGPSGNGHRRGAALERERDRRGPESQSRAAINWQRAFHPGSNMRSRSMRPPRWANPSTKCW